MPKFRTFAALLDYFILFLVLPLCEGPPMLGGPGARVDPDSVLLQLVWEDSVSVSIGDIS